MEFITREDFHTHMYEGVINAIEDDNNDALTEAIDTAQGEAFGYLGRFDLDAILNSTDRRTYASLRTYLKDIAKWHFINVCNVATDLNLAERRYDDAIARLKDIQSGKTTPRGWAIPTSETDQVQAIIINSNPKRNNHY